MTKQREVLEGAQAQGVDESIVYTVTTTPWGSTPTTPALKVYELVDGAWVDRTATVAPVGAAAATGDVIALPAIKNLTEGHTYRAVVTFTVSGNILSAYFDIQAEK